jgi:hypothetical protein
MDITYMIEEGKHYLVDTGSPFSINYGHSTTSELITGLLPNLLNDVSEEVGMEIHGLVGTDVLSQTPWHIYSDGYSDRSSGNPIIDDYKHYTITTYMTLPVVQIHINGEPRTMILDTCSSLTYLRPALLNGEPADVKQDFHPMIGRYTCRSFRSSVTGYGVKKHLDVCEIPPAVLSALTKEIDGILGVDFLSDYEWILNLRDRTLWSRKPIIW